jgi:catechol 2,3-dioxygenase-like lactoylglutathione lyase family enzyme
MDSLTLVGPLFDGPLDIVADVHGEMQALQQLLQHLGYSGDGEHGEGRHLVFLGDLTDRGPDSPAVVELVGRLVYAGRAQCVLGNHDLNLLLGEPKKDNHWFFGETEVLDDGSGRVVPQRLADEATRHTITNFFAGLPLVLERKDLRVVHACWDPGAINLARHETSTVPFYEKMRYRIEEWLRSTVVVDETEAEMARQNRNPVKVLTSGTERRAREPFEAGGKTRLLERADWWASYRDGPACVFGHYGRLVPRQGAPPDDLLNRSAPYAALGNSRAFCIDYSAEKRYKERFFPGFNGRFQARLAALRWPERILVFDDGKTVPAGAPAVSIEGISAITLATHDMARAVRFYRALGFVPCKGGESADFTSLRAGASFLNLVVQPAGRKWSWWGRVIIHVADVDAVYQQVLAHGLSPQAAPADAHWGERYFHIMDPDGHELSFARPLGAE